MLAVAFATIDESNGSAQSPVNQRTCLWYIPVLQSSSEFPNSVAPTSQYQNVITSIHYVHQVE
jgi:hypothetical protein